MAFRRYGSISTFSLPGGVVDSEQDETTVVLIPGRVHVVGRLEWCDDGPTGPLTVGCAPPGKHVFLVERPDEFEPNAWAHEYGHTQGLWYYFGGGHNPDENFLGYDQLTENARRLTQQECDTMRAVQY